MYSHQTVGTNDPARSKKFYDALFTAIGGKEGFADDKGRTVYMHKGAVFIVTPPIDGLPATAGNGCTIGFGMDSPEMVDAWHAAGVANGGTSIEDPPGWREGAFGKLYLAYLRDPDGHKLSAMKRS